VNTYISWETDSAKSERCNMAALAEVRVADLSSDSSNYRAQDVTPAIFGNRTSLALPENVTFAVQAGTGKRGRGKQGRVFWIGLCEDQTAGSTMDVDRAAAIVAELNTLKDSVASDTGGTMVTLHRKAGGVVLDPATVTDIGTYGASDLTTDSMKNRLPNHKRHKKPRP